jgi:hypothetical protein
VFKIEQTPVADARTLGLGRLRNERSRVHDARIDCPSPRVEQVQKGNRMFTILIVVLFLMLLGVIPAWPHSRQWGYYPSGGLGLLLLILVLLVLSGRV